MQRIYHNTERFQREHIKIVPMPRCAATSKSETMCQQSPFSFMVFLLFTKTTVGMKNYTIPKSQNFRKSVVFSFTGLYRPSTYPCYQMMVAMNTMKKGLMKNTKNKFTWWKNNRTKEGTGQRYIYNLIVKRIDSQ